MRRRVRPPLGLNLWQWAERPDAQHTAFTKRVSRWKAGTVLSDEVNCTIRGLSRMCTRTSRKTSAALIGTWTEMHRAWFGKNTFPWPLTVDEVLAVASVMEKQGYMSFANYASAAKEHIVVARKCPSERNYEQLKVSRDVDVSLDEIHAGLRKLAQELGDASNGSCRRYERQSSGFSRRMAPPFGRAADQVSRRVPQEAFRLRDES